MAIGRRNAFFVSVMSLGNAQILQRLAANVTTLAGVVPVEEFGSKYDVEIPEYNGQPACTENKEKQFCDL